MSDLRIKGLQVLIYRNHKWDNLNAATYGNVVADISSWPLGDFNLILEVIFR